MVEPGEFSDLKSKLNFEWNSEHHLLEPFNYINSTQGKQFRLKLIDAFNSWLDVGDSDLATISTVIDKLHNASLLIDDIEDDSDMRRGLPVAHRIYGTPSTINTANYIYFIALDDLLSLNDLNLIKIVNDELMNLHRGQGMDLYYRDNHICPTTQQYLEMVNNKTGGLLRLAVRLMSSKSSSNLDLIPLINVIGVLFQIRDDYCNLFDSSYTKNKGFAEDISEGKFSYPIIHGIHADAQSNQIVNILKQRTKDHDLKLYLVNYLNTRTLSAQATITVINDLHQQALDEIDRLGGNDDLVRILNDLKL
ncbi:hypothetical protein E3P99_03695 [Wallemia hederae]|uniref:(2E,6E)-farnesyl diphosphate synthase n=1 Tax=Wallemia hederae TaxID=1540922 RepID=A0A4T0FGL2_9BASI|nr:hypothetical protein E3P99_03695 [Wallemia hederae]